MTHAILYFLLGFAALVGGAEILVRGAASLARRFRISGLAAGLLITGIGSSVPEFGVLLSAHLAGRTNLGLGTIIGSDTYNLLFILGFAALLSPIVFRKQWVERDLLWNVFSIVAAGAVALFPLNGENAISRVEGVLLIAFFVIWVYVTLRSSHESHGELKSFAIHTPPLSLLMVGAGLVGVVWGGVAIVNSSTTLAHVWGLGETLIGLLIIGPGTSLPEFAVTAVAAYRGQAGIAVGNILGSVIFDFLGIFGVAALLRPLVFPQQVFFDLSVTACSAVFLLASLFVGRRYILTRGKGLLFLALYVGYSVIALNLHSFFINRIAAF